MPEILGRDLNAAWREVRLHPERNRHAVWVDLHSGTFEACTDSLCVREREGRVLLERSYAHTPCIGRECEWWLVGTTKRCRSCGLSPAVRIREERAAEAERRSWATA